MHQEGAYDTIFGEWFKTIDDDGDGMISIVEMANYLKVLENRILTRGPKTNSFLKLKNKMTRLTVADVLQELKQ